MINRRPRQSTDPGHQADAAASQRLRLQSDKAPEALFIQNRGQLPIALSCGACLRRSNHSETLCREIPPWESRSTNSSRSVAIMTQLFMDEPLESYLRRFEHTCRRQTKMPRLRPIG